jgi:general secretion pathway protein I
MKPYRGFTLIEVLAAMLLMAIVLPTVMQGVAAATRTASDSRHRTEAAGLAEEKLNEILATGQWQGGTLAGDFGNDWPAYTWQANVNGWAADTTSVGLQQIDLSVHWNGPTRQQSVTLSTLAYVRGQTTTTTTGTSGLPNTTP